MKKVKFNSSEFILLRKNVSIVINIDDIEEMEYTRPTFFNYFFASGLFPGGTFPGYLKISLNKKINKSKTYFIKINRKQILQLPKVYLKKIDPTNKLCMY